MTYKRVYFLGSVSLLILLVLLNLFGISKYFNSASVDFDSAFFEPTLNWSLAFIVSSILLLSVGNATFQKWFKRFFIWFVPLGLLITFTSDVYGGIPQPGRADIAAWFSGILVFSSVLLVLGNAAHSYWHRKS
jgi:hypothetical protein